jgi:hypothetical protein
MNRWFFELTDYSINQMQHLSGIQYPEGMWATVDEHVRSYNHTLLTVIEAKAFRGEL